MLLILNDGCLLGNQGVRFFDVGDVLLGTGEFVGDVLLGTGEFCLHLLHLLLHPVNQLQENWNVNQINIIIQFNIKWK